MLTLTIEFAFSVGAALRRDPRAQSEAIKGVGLWDEGVPVDVDVVGQTAPAFLPLVGVRVP
jgi:hypothetical protein